MEQVCQLCQSPMEFRQGVNKAGKPYAGNFCTNQNCKNVVWVSTQNASQQPQTAPPQPQTAQRVVQPSSKPSTGKDEMFLMSYAKDVAIKNAELSTQPITGSNIWGIYEALKQMIAGTYGPAKVTETPHPTETPEEELAKMQEGEVPF